MRYAISRNILKKMAIPRGDFSFIYDDATRIYLKDAWQAIEKTNTWDDLKSKDVPGEGGFMFSSHPVIKKIYSGMDDSLGHSGATFGWTMRQMEYIAKDGWETWVEEVLKNREGKKKSMEEKNKDYKKKIESLENKVFTLEDEIRSLRARLAEK